MSTPQRKLYTIEISTKTILTVFLIVGFIWLLVKLYGLILLLFVAFSIAAMVSPVIDYLQKRRVPRTLSIVIIYLLFVSGLITMVVLTYNPLMTQIQGFIRELPDILSNVIESIIETFPPLEDALDWESLLENLQEIQVSDFSDQLLSGLNTIFGFVGSFFGILFNIVSTLILSIYFIQFKEQSKKKVIKYLPKKHRELITELVNKIEEQLGSWMRAQVFLMVLIGFLAWLGLKIINVEFALPLGILAGLFEAVPNVGPTVTWIVALFVGFGSQLPAWKIIFIAIWFILIQQFENYLIVPKTMEKAVGTNPIVTIIAILIGSKILGLWGALLAVPTVAILEISLEYYQKVQENSHKKNN